MTSSYPPTRKSRTLFGGIPPRLWNPHRFWDLLLSTTRKLTFGLMEKNKNAQAKNSRVGILKVLLLCVFL